MARAPRKPARLALVATTDLSAARRALSDLSESDRSTDLEGAVALAREVRVDPSMALGQVPKPARAALIERVVERELPLTGTLGYEKAEVTAGGVRLSEVNPSTLESRLVPRLYLCGEVLDVEGRLGGFNFQWSWSSGRVAVRASAST